MVVSDSVKKYVMASKDRISTGDSDKKYEALFQQLLDAKADVSGVSLIAACGREPDPPGVDLAYCVRQHIKEREGMYVKPLLDANADANMRTEGGDLPLHATVRKCKGELLTTTMQLLLEAGASLNAQTAAGHTALFEAVNFTSEQAITQLVNAKADLNAQVLPSCVCGLRTVVADIIIYCFFFQQS